MKKNFWFIWVLLVMCGAALFAQTEAGFDTKAEGAPKERVFSQ